MPIHLDRRRFLRDTGLLLAGAPLSRALNAQTTDDYRALVCVFLFGGLDCHDVLIPADTASWNDYARLREPLLAQYGTNRLRSKLLPLEGAISSENGSRSFALPPELSGLKSLFDRGRLSWVGNVGPLVTATNRASLEARSVPLPPRLFSHNDQQSVWQASAPEGAQYGWGGLFADALIGSKLNRDATFTTVTGGGADLFLTGRQNVPYQVNVAGPTEFELAELLDVEANSSLTAFSAMLDARKAASGHVLVRDTADAMIRGFSANRDFARALAAAPNPDNPFPSTGLGLQLRAVARTIAARQALGVRRQLFIVGAGGFDSHSNQARTLPQLMQTMDTSLLAFNNAMEDMGLGNSVTLFTASDFGRTLAVNGDGTDHGWGGHHLVMGGAVQGGQILGTVPPATLGHDQDAGGGRLIPTIAVDQYAAALGIWLGLSQAAVSEALPNLANFSSQPLTGLFRT
ncbi:DUF1501 domain-containing protein [Pseudohaliea rubra]|uniref:Tat (Twin-arginine translocation) pathway signal sequence domain protein n=1 Tax=Pseudohaliea rubra DSM 19751 TaxID=1265313 RepID=A0A095VSY5_9GAMM|nr:DUF1501 domain-containing protein [Pseudohaliea rubra]KGE04178.1 hypothetical protein HRUBRA_01207 [Pseudohaliea rubra DSM 19751]